MNLTFADGRRVECRRIYLSPWERKNLDPDELERLDARADALGVHVTSILRTRAPRGHVVRVGTHERRIELRAQGAVLAIVAGALDDWEQAA